MASRFARSLPGAVSGSGVQIVQNPGASGHSGARVTAAVTTSVIQ